MLTTLPDLFTTVMVCPRAIGMACFCGGITAAVAPMYVPWNVGLEMRMQGSLAQWV